MGSCCSGDEDDELTKPFLSSSLNQPTFDYGTLNYTIEKQITSRYMNIIIIMIMTMRLLCSILLNHLIYYDHMHLSIYLSMYLFIYMFLLVGCEMVKRINVHLVTNLSHLYEGNIIVDDVVKSFVLSMYILLFYVYFIVSFIVSFIVFYYLFFIILACNG